MKSLYSLTLLIIFTVLTLAGNAATKTWNGGASGNWNTGGNWAPTGVPAAGDDVIINTSATISINVNPATLRSITVSGNVTVTLVSSGSDRTITLSGGTPALSVASGVTLILNGAGSGMGATGLNVNFQNGGTTETASIAGTLQLNAAGDAGNISFSNSNTTVTGTILRNGGSITSSATNLSFASGGTYQHNMNGSSIPTATWNANSTVNITGITNSVPTGLNGQTFGHFIWNSNQSATINLEASFTVAGNMTISQTGDEDLRMLNGNTSRTITVNGDFTFSANSNDVFTIVSANGTGTLNVGGNFIKTGNSEFILTEDNGAGTLNVTGDFSMSAGTLNMSADNATIGTINVAGNFSHTGGTITETNTASGLIVLNGTNPQAITGGGTVSGTINYKIDNSSSTGVTLNTAYTIANTLTLTDGLVYTASGKELTIGSGGSVVGASDASFVVGPIRKVLNSSAGFEFPTGKEGAGYIPIAITNVSSDGTYEAELVPSPATSKGDKQGLSWIDPCQYWSLKKVSGSPSTATATVTMHWNAHSTCGSTSYVNDYTALRIARHSGNPVGEGTYWNTNGISSAPSGNNISGNVSWSVPAASNITATTLFALGSTAEQPIPTPVKFGDIKAYAKGKGVQIDWDVYSEFNVARYEIERSGDGIRFSYAGNVAAKNQDGKLYYNWFDATPLAGNNYYRIKNVDIDGKFEYSTIVKVSLDKLSAGVTLYPNPVQGSHISIQAGDVKKGDYRIEIFNSAGQQVYGKQFTHAGGNITHSIELPATMQRGVYHLQLRGEGYRQTKSFLLQ